MGGRPGPADEAVVGALRAGFGIRVADLEPLAVGNDAASWSYRVQAAGGPAWFLKVRAGAGAMPGAAVPAHLHRQGVPSVLAPLPTGDGAAWVAVDGFALALYPLLEAGPGAEVGLSPEQWSELGAAVRRIHELPPTPELAAIVGQEAFRPSRRELLADLEARVAAAPRTTRWPATWPGSGGLTGT